MKGPVSNPNWVVVDCEALGRSPCRGFLTEFGAVHYDTEKAFHGELIYSVPDPDNPAIPMIVGGEIEPLADVFTSFAGWLKLICPARPVFWSDNVAFDYQWINDGFDRADMDNPFGHSGRRISDFYAGLKQDVRCTQAWKTLRVTQHDHNPVHDALGNVQAMKRIFAGERP